MEAPPGDRGAARRGAGKATWWLLATAVAVAVAGVAWIGAALPVDQPPASAVDPDVEPAADAAPVADPLRERLVIHGTGDVNLDPSYIRNFRRYGYEYAWSGLDGLFLDDDLTVVNLECPVSDLVAPLDKDFVFRCDPAALPAARAAGVDVANLGNNHAYDHGPEALIDSAANLVAHGIAPVGAGRDEAQATEPALFEIKGWSVAVVGIGNVIDPEPDSLAGPDKPGVACNDDIGCMVAAVRRADESADVVVVTIHWGVELHPEPGLDQVEIARSLVDAGADAVFGHHSHRLGELETYGGRPIFWSLGNFVWPRLSAAGSITAVAEVVVTPDGAVHGRLLPAVIESSGHPVLRDR